jgi:hypothetical protein
MPPLIRTTCVYPPIPVRGHDWQAVYDDDEPNDDGQMVAGWGATKEAAIESLLEQDDRTDDRTDGATQ